MRWADIAAFFTSAMWFGCNVAFGIVPAVMFAQVKIHAVDATQEQVGELFGQVALRWGWVSLMLLGLLTVARLVGWTLRLRQGTFRRSSLIGVLLFAAVTVFAVLATVSYHAVEDQRVSLEKLDEDSPERPVAAAMFQVEHERSVQLSRILTALLLAQSLTLGISLAKRDRSAFASRTLA